MVPFECAGSHAGRGRYAAEADGRCSATRLYKSNPPTDPTILFSYVLAIFGSEKDRIRDRTGSRPDRTGFEQAEDQIRC